MMKLVLILLCAALVNARWSIHYGAKDHDEDHEHVHDQLDWWEHSVFYQVSHGESFVKVFLN